MRKDSPIAVLTIGALLGVGVGAQSPTPLVIDGKFDTSTEHVLIPVDIGGHQFWCNPDSGYSALISLDRSKAVAAGLPISPGVSTPDGNPPTPGDNSAVVDVSIAGVAFPNFSVIVRRFPEEAPDMDCIMGVGVLRRFVVEIDHMVPRVRLFPRDTYLPPPDAERIPLVFRPNPNVPYVDIALAHSDGSRQSLRVVPDTGTSYYSAVLVGRAAEQFTTRTSRTAPAITFPDPNVPDRVTQLEAARPAGINVGTFTVREPVVALLRGSLGANGSVADGTLGSGFLRRFTVTFDFEGRAMYLRPNTRMKDPQAFDATGIGLIRRAGRDVVFSVLSNSPGAVAGIQRGDVLLAVDGRRTSDYSPVELQDVLRVTGETRTLLIERSGVNLTLRVTLRSRI